MKSYWNNPLYRIELIAQLTLGILTLFFLYEYFSVTTVTWKKIWNAFGLISMFYGHTFIVIPFVLKRHNWLIYFTFLLALVIVSALFSFFTELGYSETVLKGTIGDELVQFRIPLFVEAIPLTFVSSHLFSFIKDWFKNEYIKKQLQQEKQTAELDALKSQLDPHFLFNSINHIYSIALDKNEMEIADHLQNMSELLRYVVDLSPNEKISLQDEIEFLEKFVSIHKSRLQDNAKIQLTIDGYQQETRIAPLLLLPFVENAFKHGISTIQDCKIDIRLKQENNRLHFCVSNSNFVTQDKFHDRKGIGIANVKKRLTILYPKKHKLEIIQNDSEHIVKLEIDLD